MPLPSLNVAERRRQPPEVGVSTVIFALQPLAGQPAAELAEARQGLELWVPLVRRIRPPFGGSWALPGGPLAWDRSLDETARATLLASTGLAPRHLEQLYSFGGVERSATDRRQVTIAYWALLGVDQTATAVETDNLCWFPVGALPHLAFDHDEILAVALDRLRAKTVYADLAGRFLGPVFTLADLRLVHDAVLGARSDPANFRRRILASGQVEPTGQQRRDGAHRPAQLYRFSGPAGAEALGPGPLAPRDPDAGARAPAERGASDPRPHTLPQSTPADPETRRPA